MSSTLYRNGAVHSAADPFAESLLVADGSIAWIGSDDTADGLADRADEVIDLDGAIVTPAFVDSCTSLLDVPGPAQVDLRAARSVDQVLQTLSAVGGEHPVRGYGVALWSWIDGPSRWELDRAVGGRPALIVAVDGRTGVVSSELARNAGLMGRPGWSPDGRVTGPAMDAALAGLGEHDHRSRQTAYRQALASAARAGVVAVHEVSDPARETRSGLAELLRATADPASGLPQVIGYRQELCRTDDDVRTILAEVPGLTGVMAPHVDGSVASRTARLGQRYLDDPTTGQLYLSAEDIANHVGSATRAGVQAGLAAVGDAAVAEVLLGLRAAAEIEGAAALMAAHHRLDDLAMIDGQSLAQLLLLGIGGSAVPDLSLVGEDLLAARLGPARLSSLHPLGDLSRAGMPIGLGSAGTMDLWAQVKAAFNHRRPDQRMSARAAFRLATRGGWRLAGLDGTGAGEIRVGAPAHLAVWRAQALTVESVDGRFSSWSTDAKAGTPLLPSVAPDAPTPECLRCTRSGEILHDTFR